MTRTNPVPTRMGQRRPKTPVATSSGSSVATVGVRRIFSVESGNYFLLLGTTLFLVFFGLVMVLSSSSVEALTQDKSSFSAFLRQGLFALVGIPLMLVASAAPPRFWRRWAWQAIALGVFLQLLVFSPLGSASGGNQNWIIIGSFSAQPSEVLKLALIVWIGMIIVTKQDLLGDWKHLAIPIGPIAGGAIALVLVGNDLGTAVMMLFIVFGCLFYAGVRLRYLSVAMAIVSLLGLVIAFASASRTSRINAWLYGCTEADYERFCWQPTHGTWALASGGIFGVGLGNSKAKWSWLPEADNDYIFAIIGEELGLIGAIVVLLLFVVMAIAFMRIIRSTTDLFARVVTGGVMVWLVGQAFVNIAVVLGVLPVLGVPLPLISAGGSALISTLLAVGVVLSFARKPMRPNDEFIEQTPAERSRLAAAQRARPTR